LEKSMPLSEDIKKLHLEHLELLRKEKVLEWEMDLIVSQLKFALGLHDEIEEICKWKRVKKEDKEEFDEASFKSQLPDLYAQYLISKPGVFKVVINNTRPYPI
ncbi:MAG: hypothetical protein ACK44B_11825, partial [Flavobacteriales bacterium]